MMTKVLVLSGVSGSGKSTHVRRVLGGEYKVAIVSTDHYFMKGGVYKFDPKELSNAHAACFREYILKLKAGWEQVVVDNTNTTAVEFAPYILGAQAFGYENEILTLMCETEEDIQMCAARNTHGVPLNGVVRQHCNIQDRQLPPWWKNTTIRVEK